MNLSGPRIPSAPLAAAIRSDAAKRGGMSILERRTGISQRTFRRVFKQRGVTLDLADRYCTATGRILDDLYPEPYPYPEPPPPDLVVARLKGRLRPSLVERHGDTVTPIAYFVSDEAMQRYLELTEPA